MMNARGVLVVILAALAFTAFCRAAESPQPFVCADVRAAVKSVQQTASVTPERAAAIVEAMARGQGVGERVIVEARRCLNRD